MKELIVQDIRIEVQKKKIKNIHLSVYPPDGKVKVSAPIRYNMNIIKVFILSKMDWIRKAQEKFRSQVREEPREFLDRESHYYKGERYLLRLVETDSTPKVEIGTKEILVYIRCGSKKEKVQEILEKFYRKELKEIIPQMIQKWEDILRVKVNEFGIKKMKTKWGTCNITEKRIWLNLELIKKPIECLDYVVLHEIAHLLERHHNAKFKSILDKALPNWRFVKKKLDTLPSP
jgi:predicted metal-dependent hydrolase